MLNVLLGFGKEMVNRMYWRLFLVGLCYLPLSCLAADSMCFGTPSNGRLEGGVQIPASGDNFQPYAKLGVTLGRTYVHGRVAQVIGEAYASLGKTHPQTIFVYGESGWPEGGPIKPHRTHQNGLAVDFMVPVRNAEGESIALPSSPGNTFGYGLEFDADGRLEDLTIDFEAIAAHLHALHAAAAKQGVGLARVILTPEYIPKLYGTSYGDFIKQNITFMKGQAWVRHDEHYHVDFAVPCKAL